MHLSKRIPWVLSIWLGFWAGNCMADQHDLPEIGKRVYVPDTNSAIGKNDIRTATEAADLSEKGMRDVDLQPIRKALPTKTVKNKKKKKKAEIAKVYRKRGAGDSVLKFKPKSVSGRKTSPRVQFQVPRLAVPRTDQPFPSGTINASLRHLTEADQDL